ncbi:hypothetical protein V8C43DRAFT_293664 [Trichoderma afarasin]
MADRVPSGSLYSVADGRIAENVVSRRGNRPGQRALVRPDDRRPILRFASGVRRKEREKKSERDKERPPPQKNLFLGDICVRVCCPLTHSLTHSTAPPLTYRLFSFLFLFSAPLVPPFYLVSWLLRLCLVMVLGR